MYLIEKNSNLRFSVARC